MVIFTILIVNFNTWQHKLKMVDFHMIYEFGRIFILIRQFMVDSIG